jgi:hypothetical protein
VHPLAQHNRSLHETCSTKRQAMCLPPSVTTAKGSTLVQRPCKLLAGMVHGAVAASGKAPTQKQHMPSRLRNAPDDVAVTLMQRYMNSEAVDSTAAVWHRSHNPVRKTTPVAATDSSSMWRATLLSQPLINLCKVHACQTLYISSCTQHLQPYTHNHCLPLLTNRQNVPSTTALEPSNLHTPLRTSSEKQQSSSMTMKETRVSCNVNGFID